MPFKKGDPKIGGRGPGSQNKTTSAIKDAMIATFVKLQHDPKNNLTAWAKDNPTEFYKLSGKLIPTEIKGDIKFTKVELFVNRTKNINIPEGTPSLTAADN